MKLSRTIAYALHAVLQLAEADSTRPVPCSELAAKGKMPERFLLQILRNLVAQGLLQSTRGVEGGYRLKLSPHDVSLLDVIEAIDGPLGTEIPASEGLAEETQSRLQNALCGVTAGVRSRLQAVTLADLLPTGNGGTAGDAHGVKSL